jgi:type II secretory pathway component PulF
MSDATPNGSKATLPTAIMAFVHVLVWLPFLAQVYVFIPRRERVFRDFNLKLPGATEAIIALSQWMWKYWYVAAFAVLLAVLVDVALLWILKRRQRLLALLWFILVILAAVLLELWIEVSLGLLYGKLAEGLSR